MRKILSTTGLSTLLLLFVVTAVLPVSSAGSGTVTATVTPKEISVLVTPISITYGVVQVGQNAVAPTPDTEIAVNNNGTVAEKFSIKGSNASATVGGTIYSWTLSNVSTGTDRFMHKYAPGSAYSTWTVLSDNYAQFVPSEPVGFGESLKFRISMPTEISGPGESYSTGIYILAEEA